MENAAHDLGKLELEPLEALDAGGSVLVCRKLGVDVVWV